MTKQYRCRKCKDVISSKHRHHFVTCKCGSIHVDGGSDYERKLWPSGSISDWFEEENTMTGWTPVEDRRPKDAP